MKLAFVYDRINKWGGAERVLMALHEIWPDAPIYTSVYDNNKALWARVFDIRTTFLQQFPFIKSHHEFIPWLTPFAFELLRLDGYDVVLSITSAEAKNIITKPGTLHICYCLTPTRYLWSNYDDYVASPGFGSLNRVSRFVFKNMAPILQKWDIVASSRPDFYIAISQFIKQRIEKYYHRKADAVIYPPVDTEKFKVNKIREKKDHDFFLVVSRLVGYKRIDIIINAFNILKLPLVIIGSGSHKAELQKQAKSNIKFISDNLTDEELVRYYQNCRAFVFAGKEDFGIVAGEAQACGRPVIAYRRCGIAEIVKHEETGLLFERQDVSALVDAVRRLKNMHFEKDICRNNVLRFRKEQFQKNMRNFIKEKYSINL